MIRGTINGIWIIFILLWSTLTSWFSSSFTSFTTHEIEIPSVAAICFVHMYLSAFYRLITALCSCWGALSSLSWFFLSTALVSAGQWSHTLHIPSISKKPCGASASGMVASTILLTLWQLTRHSFLINKAGIWHTWSDKHLYLSHARTCAARGRVIALSVSQSVSEHKMRAFWVR